MSIDLLIDLAFREDIPKGDITSEGILDKNTVASGCLMSKGDYVVSGISLAEKIYSKVDKNLVFKKIKNDGDLIKAENIIFEISGNVISILKAERVVLNFLGVLFSVATSTRRYVNLIKHTKVKLLDTRKTIPGMRELMKKAVLDGGGCNHRLNLSDSVLIKENHISAAGSILKCVKSFKNKKIELEVKNLKELQTAIDLKVDIVMLDNFKVSEVIEAVKLNKSRVKLEVSGGINEKNILSYAETGVDFISVGALTHTIHYADISFLLCLK